ncbi:MAG: ISL3 family transposase, partial [Chloroflexota bacterium]|nr:ISL3 family transposase [Chloroflexota bacterium]
MLADLCAVLLPGAPQLRLDTIELDPRLITLHMTSTQAIPACPDCGHAAQRLHSGYVRTLADLPWADLAARILLRVRRFFCDHSACARTTFTERLPGLVAPHARRTQRLATAQTDVGLALGGAAGERLTAKQHMPASRNTLLRLIRRVPAPSTGAPRVVGLDDWAKRKGHSYGTIVVDLETQAPIDLLDDRLAETVEAWLHAHPTVEVISRDRAEAYASGATAGAPNAVQVADRFHLLKNLCEAIEQELNQHGVRIGRTASDDIAEGVRPAVVEAAPGATAAPGEPIQSGSGETQNMAPRHAHPASMPASVPEVPTIYPDTPAGRRAETTRQARRSERFAQYTQVVALRDQGLDQPTIARLVGISARTVSRWLAGDGFPERKPRSGEASCLDPYKPVLLERWQAGCHNGTHLWRMIQAQGFAGSYGLVADYLAPLRRGEAVCAEPSGLPSAASVAKGQCYTARQAAFLFLRRPTDLTASEQQDLAQLQAEDGVLAPLYTLTQEFAAMVRERAAARLDGWLD